MGTNAAWGNLLSNWYSLYSGMTKSELALEPYIACLGVRYRSQHLMPGIGGIVDFALLDSKLVIEVDGASHKQTAQKIKDVARTVRLNKQGWTVARVTNQEVEAAPIEALRKALQGFPHLQARLDERCTYALSAPRTDEGADPQPCTTSADPGARLPDSSSQP